MSYHRTLRLTSLIAVLGAGFCLATGFAAEASDKEKAKEASAAATQEETDVSTLSMGAITKGEGKNLRAVLEGKQDAVAELITNRSGIGEMMVKLAGPAKITRVLVKLAPTPEPGRLIIVGLKSQDDKVDLSDLSKIPNLIAVRELDEKERTYSFDVSKLTVLAVKLYWIPRQSARPLLLSKVGIYTREQMIAGADATPYLPTASPAALPPAILPQSTPVSN